MLPEERAHGRGGFRLNGSGGAKQRKGTELLIPTSGQGLGISRLPLPRAACVSCGELKTILCHDSAAH